MAKLYLCVYFIAIFVAAVLEGSSAETFTDPLDLVALQDLYKILNQPPQLTGWRLDGGDPCDEDDSWNAVSCFGPSVTIP